MAKNGKLIPEAKYALDLMKYEIAAELGLFPQRTDGGSDTEFAAELGTMNAVNNDYYWGHISSRDTGAVGGAITARLVKKAEESLLSFNIR